MQLVKCVIGGCSETNTETDPEQQSSHVHLLQMSVRFLAARQEERKFCHLLNKKDNVIFTKCQTYLRKQSSYGVYPFFGTFIHLSTY